MDTAAPTTPLRAAKGGVKLPNLRAIREELGLTQAELARGVGTSEAAISRLENQQRGAGYYMALSIMAYLDGRARQEGSKRGPVTMVDLQGKTAA